MGKLVLTDAVVTVNGVNLSAFCKSARIEIEAEAIEDTTMGAGTRSNLGGLKNWSMSAEFLQDYAAAAVDATLWPLLGVSTVVSVKATSAATSATNPLYQGTAIMTNYQPVGGNVGEINMTSCTFACASPLSRLTA